MPHTAPSRGHEEVDGIVAIHVTDAGYVPTAAITPWAALALTHAVVRSACVIPLATSAGLACGYVVGDTSNHVWLTTTVLQS